MKQFIINPKDNKKYSIYTKKGVSILKKYINQYISTYGGSNELNIDQSAFYNANSDHKKNH